MRCLLQQCAIGLKGLPGTLCSTTSNKAGLMLITAACYSGRRTPGICCNMGQAADARPYLKLEQYKAPDWAPKWLQARVVCMQGIPRVVPSSCMLTTASAITDRHRQSALCWDISRLQSMSGAHPGCQREQRCTSSGTT